MCEDIKRYSFGDLAYLGDHCLDFLGADHNADLVTVTQAQHSPAELRLTPVAHVSLHVLEKAGDDGAELIGLLVSKGECRGDDPL